MLAKTDNVAEVGLHVFERAGLGKAPFRCVGFSEMVINHPDGTTQAGGSCQYCFTGIRYACHIRSRNGRTFHVGTDCVAKTGDVGLIKSYKQRPEVRAANRAKAAARDHRIIAEWSALISEPANRATLAAVMIPGPQWKPEPQSLLFGMERVWGMCGASGRARQLKHLKKKLAELAGAAS